MTAGLLAEGLHKRYGERVAVQQVTLQVRPGELLALLGPNGAGKSTTLGLLCGLLPADAGSVRVDGQALAEAPDAYRRRIGLVPQDLALFETLSARRNLELFGALYGLSRAQLRERVPALLARVGLQDRANEPPARFSGGMKRRLHIACALVHQPRLLLLDEPTAGVDPQSRNAIFEILEQLKREGTALVYTTHYMEEAERLADRIVIVDAGRVVAEGTLPQLLARLPVSQQLRLQFATEPDEALLDPLRALPGVQSLQRVGEGRLRLAVGELARDSAAVLAALQGVALQQIDSAPATLEDVFLHLTGKALRDSA